MTSKETIYRQDVLDLAKKGVLISNGNYESVCKAINEIPSVNPIEPCKDAIDRAKAIMIASGYCHPANVAKELAKLPAVNPQPSGDTIDRKLVCAFIAGLISDDGEREKGLEYIRNMPPVNSQEPKYCDRDICLINEYNDISCDECEVTKGNEEKQEQTRDEKMIDAIDFAIKATDTQDDYSMGMRNGMRYVKSLIDGKKPEYELRRTDEEKELGIDLGDEVVGDYRSKGVVVGIDTHKEAGVMLSLLMRNHKVPQLVQASRYKTKTGRHFEQIVEVLEQIKGEVDGK